MRLNLIILFFILSNTFAGEGIVTTLEAPLLSDRSIDAKVVQTARKGDKIYIHDKYFINGPLDVVYRADDKQDTKELSRLEDGEGYERFYETIDRNGNTAYISRYFVKLITGDIREFSQNITPFNPDPNDYRPEEPLPEGYPIVKKERYRARLSFMAGPDLKSNYNYNILLSEEQFSNRYGFDLSYGRKAAWDKEDRFYFGGVFQGWTSQAKFVLFDDRKATENKSQIGIGPYLSYDPWRQKDMTLTLQGSLLVTFNRNSITQKDTDGFDEERIFSAFTVSPRLSSFIQVKTKSLGVDFVAGLDMQFYLPHNLKSNKQPQTGFWNDYQSSQDTVYVPFTAHWSAFIGVQTRY